MIKLISVTWSHNDTYNFEDTILYKSFIKSNNKDNFYNIHFNRNNYQKLEMEFSEKFGYQYEFLLYRIFLLKQELLNLNFDFIIFSDINDVVCLSDINQLNPINSTEIIFSSEKHRYPNEENITNWEPNYKYSLSDVENKSFLNAGLSIGKRESFIELFDECIKNVLPKEYKNFGGDQGVFTYFYLNNQKNKILLDSQTKYFLSTYSDSPSNYIFMDGKLKNLLSNQTPIFIHDNGWNYGSPKFINHFNLIDIS
jgi:hypothetical protein